MATATVVTVAPPTKDELRTIAALATVEKTRPRGYTGVDKAMGIDATREDATHQEVSNTSTEDLQYEYEQWEALQKKKRADEKRDDADKEENSGDTREKRKRDDDDKRDKRDGDKHEEMGGEKKKDKRKTKDDDTREYEKKGGEKREDKKKGGEKREYEKKGDEKREEDKGNPTLSPPTPHWDKTNNPDKISPTSPGDYPFWAHDKESEKDSSDDSDDKRPETFVPGTQGAPANAVDLESAKTTSEKTPPWREPKASRVQKTYCDVSTQTHLGKNDFKILSRDTWKRRMHTVRRNIDNARLIFAEDDQRIFRARDRLEDSAQSKESNDGAQCVLMDVDANGEHANADIQAFRFKRPDLQPTDDNGDLEPRHIPCELRDMVLL
jgi:hypothetical protein